MRPERRPGDEDVPRAVPQADRWLAPFAFRHASPAEPRAVAEQPAWEERFTASRGRQPTPAERERWYARQVFILRERARDFFNKNPTFSSLLDRPAAIRLEGGEADRSGGSIDPRQGSGQGPENTAAAATQHPVGASNGWDWSYRPTAPNGRLLRPLSASPTLPRMGEGSDVHGQDFPPASANGTAHPRSSAADPDDPRGSP